MPIIATYLFRLVTANCNFILEKAVFIGMCAVIKRCKRITITIENLASFVIASLMTSFIIFWKKKFFRIFI